MIFQAKRWHNGEIQTNEHCLRYISGTSTYNNITSIYMTIGKALQYPTMKKVAGK